MKIRVTKEDIRKGKRKSTCSCPVARALRRETNDNKWYVYPNWIWNGVGDHLFLSLSKAARRFIRRFDAGKNVRPFTFVLKINK